MKPTMQEISMVLLDRSVAFEGEGHDAFVQAYRTIQRFSTPQEVAKYYQNLLWGSEEWGAEDGEAGWAATVEEAAAFFSVLTDFLLKPTVVLQDLEGACKLLQGIPGVRDWSQDLFFAADQEQALEDLVFQCVEVLGTQEANKWLLELQRGLADWKIRQSMI